MVQKRWRSTLQNIRTRPSADCGSDHQLLVAKLKLRLKAKKGSRPPIMHDIDNMPVQYAVEVKNKLEQSMKMNEEEQIPNELWEDIKETVKNTAKKCIPKKRRRKQPWISQHTLDLADSRKEAKAAGDQNKRSRLNKEVTKSVKEDKRKKWVPKMDVINDVNGITLTESDDIKKRWVEYSTKLFEAQDQQVYTRGEIMEEDPAQIRSEVEQTMDQMKNTMSPGIDEMPAELWTATGKEGVDIMWRLCCRTWKEQEWPKDW
ncbi:uncharacterized protein [Amphiura filiformis]|uniref:uncharacterized protein n=1 Tax=Amphiura filiformis TaxID=82378 RepID=UPI003B2147FD